MPCLSPVFCLAIAATRSTACLRLYNGSSPWHVVVRVLRDLGLSPSAAAAQREADPKARERGWHVEEDSRPSTLEPRFGLRGAHDGRGVRAQPWAGGVDQLARDEGAAQRRTRSGRWGRRRSRGRARGRGVARARRPGRGERGRREREREVGRRGSLACRMLSSGQAQWAASTSVTEHNGPHSVPAERERDETRVSNERATGPSPRSSRRLGLHRRLVRLVPLHASHREVSLELYKRERRKRAHGDGALDALLDADNGLVPEDAASLPIQRQCAILTAQKPAWHALFQCCSTGPQSSRQSCRASCWASCPSGPAPSLRRRRSRAR